MGLPFLPVRGIKGTDMRRLHPEYAETTCPFTGEVLVAVPPLRPDVALLHAPFGDIRGNRAAGKGLEFWGGSFWCDPFGRVIAEASHDKEEILVGKCDLKLLEEVRRNWPFLRDRRIDAYAGITQRFLD